MLFNHFRATSGHQEDVLPLGKWVNLRVVDSRLLGDPEFDMDDQFAAKIADKVDKDIITECSAGLFPEEWTQDEDGSIWLEKSTLREASIATIASNEDAVALYDEHENILALDANDIVKLTAKINPSTITIKNSMEEDLKIIALSIGLPETATVTQVKDKAVQLRALSTENESLKLRLKAIEDEKKIQLAAETKTLLDTAIQEQRITDAQRPAYEQLFAVNFDAAKTALSAVPKPVSLAGFVSSATDGGQSGQFQYQGKSFIQLSKDAPETLEMLRTNDPTTFRALYKAQYGKDYVQ